MAVDSTASVRPPTPTGTTGSTTMRERAEELGGQFKLDAAVGRGTEIETIVPHSMTTGTMDTRIDFPFGHSVSSDGDDVRHSRRR